MSHIQEPTSREINGDTRIHGNSSTIFFVSTDQLAAEKNIAWSIRPYAIKRDNRAMGSVTNLTVKKVHLSQQIPICTRNYIVPAVVFSTKGYAGNHFHDFTDVLIPLFQTSRRFNGEVQFLINFSTKGYAGNHFHDFTDPSFLTLRFIATNEQDTVKEIIIQGSQSLNKQVIENRNHVIKVLDSGKLISDHKQQQSALSKVKTSTGGEIKNEYFNSNMDTF
ncbi:uncharacterized protein LOC132057870 [Lycium ferocissimum]|uniref:uncharacterized protein LOC132057870 n=1 Tax=Lycium ferocissimum TaxID=112874 RepID=UPI002814BB29|nr:uncharacterized protein LOC132057870 [Lycium ferocissimum]